jgi:hypothetical protein
MKELTEERLSQFAAAFRSLGKTFLPELDKKTMGKNDVSLLIDTIADKACRNCGLAGTQNYMQHIKLHFQHCLYVKKEVKWN